MADRHNGIDITEENPARPTTHLKTSTDRQIGRTNAGHGAARSVTAGGGKETLNGRGRTVDTVRTILQWTSRSRNFPRQAPHDDDEGESSSVADDIRGRTPCIATYIVNAGRLDQVNGEIVMPRPIAIHARHEARKTPPHGTDDRQSTSNCH